MGAYEARLQWVRLPMGLILESAKLSGAALLLLGEPFEAQVSEPGDVEVDISAEHIQQFLNERSPGGLRDFFVQIADGKIHVHATARRIIEVRAAAICHIRIQDERQLFVELDKVDVMGVGARGIVQGYIDQANPIFDAAVLPIDLRLHTVEALGGRLRLSGTARPRE